MKKFMLMLVLAVFFLAFFHQATAHASPVLRVIAPLPPLQMSAASGDCAQVSNDLAEFKTKYLMNAQIVSNYVRAMSDVSGEWARDLVPFENVTATFTSGTFLPMLNSSRAVTTAVNQIGVWISQVDTDIETFTTAVDTCKMSKADHDKWIDAFQVFAERNGENLGVSVEYISSMGRSFRDWSTRWSLIENRPILLPAGEFDVVTEASEGLFESAELIESNAQMAIDELGGISFKEN